MMQIMKLMKYQPHNFNIMFNQNIILNYFISVSKDLNNLVFLLDVAAVFNNPLILNSFISNSFILLLSFNLKFKTLTCDFKLVHPTFYQFMK